SYARPGRCDHTSPGRDDEPRVLALAVREPADDCAALRPAPRADRLELEHRAALDAHAVAQQAERHIAQCDEDRLKRSRWWEPRAPGPARGDLDRHLSSRTAGRGQLGAPPLLTAAGRGVPSP